MMPSSWNGTNMRRLMSSHVRQLLVAEPQLLPAAPRRGSPGSSDEHVRATPHSHATMTFVYALLRKPPASGVRVALVELVRTHHALDLVATRAPALKCAIEAQKRAISSIISAP